MQLYALDLYNKFINVARAIPGKDYFCHECRALVRVRGGPRMQRHFYHYKSGSDCRQEGKGIVHLAVQTRIIESLPEGEGAMEVHFPTIRRIADVAYASRKIVFEVQCAQMQPEEALARTSDYASIGWQVIWILHDARYNGKKRTTLEEGLIKVPHYYTNISDEGVGIFYDQLVIWKDQRRYFESYQREIKLELTEKNQAEVDLRLLFNRMENWPVLLEGDFLNTWERDNYQQLWEQMRGIERSLDRSSVSILRRLFQKMLARPYRVFFRWLLESACSG